MPKDTHKKIAIVVTSLAGGGAERSTALLSRMLDKKGFQVTIITLSDGVDFEYAGQLYNMGTSKVGGDSLIKKARRFYKLRSFIKKENFDFIIDNRTRPNALKEKFYLDYLYKYQRVVYVVRSFRLDNYFPENSTISTKMIEQSAGIVGVSKAISGKINQKYNTSKAQTIYNPVSVSLKNSQPAGEQYFIFVGRLVDAIKNVSLLIDAFAKAKNIHSTTTLKIYGDGKDKRSLQQKVKASGLEEKVNFYPFSKEIETKISNARALVLTSHYEGFPRVLIESLALGTPVISVDCKSGPNEIVKNESNGLLIPTENTDALADAMERIIFDELLYEQCKQNAQQSVSHLIPEIIGNQWENYLNSL